MPQVNPNIWRYGVAPRIHTPHVPDLRYGVAPRIHTPHVPELRYGVSPRIHTPHVPELRAVLALSSVSELVHPSGSVLAVPEVQKGS